MSFRFPARFGLVWLHAFTVPFFATIAFVICSCTRLILSYILKGKHRANRKMKSASRKYNFIHILSICLTYKRVYSTVAPTKTTHTIIIGRTLNTEHTYILSKAVPLLERERKKKFRESCYKSPKNEEENFKAIFLLLCVYRWGYVGSFYNHKMIEDLAINLSTKVHCGTYHFSSIFFFIFLLFRFSFHILFFGLFFIILLDASFLSIY